jgi:hypothetical protein
MTFSSFLVFFPVPTKLIALKNSRSKARSKTIKSKQKFFPTIAGE